MEVGSPPCRQWGVVSVLMRLKNKIREKFFCDRFLSEPDPAAGSHHDSSHELLVTPPNFHNFDDAMDGGSSGSAQTRPQVIFQTASSMGPYTQMLQSEPGPSTSSHHEQPLREAFLTFADFDMDDSEQPWPAAQGMDQQPVYAEYGRAEEYVDARMELPDGANNYSASDYSQPGRLSRVETTETTNTMDTGDSSTAVRLILPALQPAEWQRIMFLRRFLEIDGAEPAGAGWRVVLSIVSAFRRISGLVSTRRSSSQSLITSDHQTTVSTPRRIGSGTRYKGIRKRNGKWVSEIRISGTLEKVWLGSYSTEKEAALAFDAGRHHCSAQRSRNFNFADSPRLLGAPEDLLHLSFIERRTRIQRLAEDHARTYGSNADIR